MDKETQEGLQKKYMEMQMLGQQLQQIGQQLEMLDNNLQELYNTKEALDDIAKTEVEEEILAPVAGGIFIQGKLTDNKDVLVNAGTGTVVKKSIADAKVLVDNQVKEIEKLKNEMSENQGKLTLKAKLIENELSELPK